MRLRNFFALGWCVSSLAFAGELSIEGHGAIGSKPQYMKVRVDVKAECFKSSKEVVEINKKVASEIKTVLESFRDKDDDSRDQLIVLPGQTTRGTLKEWSNDQNKEIVLCKNGWHSNSSMILNVADFSVWTDLQAQIFEIVDRYEHSREENKGFIKVTLEQPSPELYPETSHSVPAQADALALADAESKFQLVVKQCGFVHAAKVKLSSTLPNAASPRAGKSRGNEPSPVLNPEFDLIWTYATWLVTWNFVDAGICKTSEI